MKLTSLLKKGAIAIASLTVLGVVSASKASTANRHRVNRDSIAIPHQVYLKQFTKIRRCTFWG